MKEKNGVEQSRVEQSRIEQSRIEKKLRTERGEKKKNIEDYKRQMDRGKDRVWANIRVKRHIDRGVDNSQTITQTEIEGQADNRKQIDWDKEHGEEKMIRRLPEDEQIIRYEKFVC